MFMVGFNLLPLCLAVSKFSIRILKIKEATIDVAEVWTC